MSSLLELELVSAMHTYLPVSLKLKFDSHDTLTRLLPLVLVMTLYQMTIGEGIPSPAHNRRWVESPLARLIVTVSDWLVEVHSKPSYHTMAMGPSNSCHKDNYCVQSEKENVPPYHKHYPMEEIHLYHI